MTNDNKIDEQEVLAAFTTDDYVAEIVRKTGSYCLHS